jgi:hypothetical protein
MIRSQLSPAAHLLSTAAALFGGLAFISAITVPARAEPGSIIGSWSGTGSIAFASGSKEKARCRAHFAKTGETSYTMSATCATSSAKVDQSAELTKVGSNRYVGSFFNQQYNTGGSIRITVSGASQSVYLAGEAGTATFSLRKL